MESSRENSKSYWRKGLNMQKNSTKIITEKIVTKISQEELEDILSGHFRNYSESIVDIQINYSCGMLDEIIITETLERNENV